LDIPLDFGQIFQRIKYLHVPQFGPGPERNVRDAKDGGNPFHCQDTNGRFVGWWSEFPLRDGMAELWELSPG
jgi:hypothetical protein